MAEIVAPGKKRYVFRTLTPAEAFSSPFDGADFVCLIWDNSGAASPSQRATLTDHLVRAGCRYVVCAGHSCEDWHDAADASFLGQGLTEDEQQQRFVVTTWHDGETEDQVVFFFVLNTGWYDEEFQNHIVLQIGPDRPREERLRRLVLKYSKGREAA